MNKEGKGNQDLHEDLMACGFTAGVNNISMWRNGVTQIPDNWIVDICRLLRPENVDEEVLEFLRQRNPHLTRYFNLPGGESVSEAKTKRTSQQEMYYIAKSGTHKGKKFLPYKNKSGNYQGGYDRFKENIVEFSDLTTLIKRVLNDDRFKVRMTLLDEPGLAPSLIAKKSLVITGGNV